MSKLFSSGACAAVLAGFALAVAAPPAHGQASGACTVEIQMAGETLATGVVGPESMGTPVDRRARGAVGALSWSWGMSSCTPAQLRDVSADEVWVPVGDVAAALGDGGGLRVDGGRLTVSHRPVADREPQLAIRHRGGLAIRDPGTRTLDKSSPKLSVTPDFGESAVISSDLRWFAGADEEEEVQTLMMPLADLGAAMGRESGGLSYTDFGLFGGRAAVDLKSGPDCTLCAVDMF